MLDPTDALVTFVVGDSQTYVWVLRQKVWNFKVADIGARELNELVMSLRARLDPAQNPTLLPFDGQTAAALYKRLFSGIERELADARHMFIVADGALQSLPFNVLLTGEPDQTGDYRKMAWLARHYGITILPTVSSLRTLRLLGKRSPAPSPFVGIGDPVLEGSPGTDRRIQTASLIRGGVADVASVRKLPRLPDTAQELQALAKAQGVGSDSLLLRENATETSVKKANLEQYRVIAFATHGLLAGDVRGLTEPALVLTPPQAGSTDDDGLLTASEIAQLRLNADWVIASACNTASGDGSPNAEGLSGLARAFLYAGSRALLVSHWPVFSKAAVRLTTSTFEALRQDPSIGRAEALRRAEMSILDDPSSSVELTHPAAWSPFIVVGEGGPGR